MTIGNFLKFLSYTPIPWILAIAGIACLLFSFLQEANTSTETKSGEGQFAVLKPGKERFTAFVGIVLLLAGAFIWFA